MKAIVTTKTDSTNVYGYVDVEPIDNDGVPASQDTLPKAVRNACKVQHQSEDAASEDCEMVATMLRNLGWYVLDAVGEPYPFWDEPMTLTQARNLIPSLCTTVETNARNGHWEAFKSNFSYLEHVVHQYKHLLEEKEVQAK